MIAKLIRSVKAGIKSAIIEWHRQGLGTEARKLEQANERRVTEPKPKPTEPSNFAPATPGYKWQNIGGNWQMCEVQL